MARIQRAARRFDDASHHVPAPAATPAPATAHFKNFLRLGHIFIIFAQLSPNRQFPADFVAHLPDMVEIY